MGVGVCVRCVRIGRTCRLTCDDAGAPCRSGAVRRCLAGWVRVPPDAVWAGCRVRDCVPCAGCRRRRACRAGPGADGWRVRRSTAVVDMGGVCAECRVRLCGARLSTACLCRRVCVECVCVEGVEGTRRRMGGCVACGAPAVCRSTCWVGYSVWRVCGPVMATGLRYREP